MAERDKIARNWIVAAEEDGGARIVLRPPDYPVPRSRGGSRRLELGGTGDVRAFASGPADALEDAGQGGWSLQGDRLILDLPGWQGEYLIEQSGDDVLVLRRL